MSDQIDHRSPILAPILLAAVLISLAFTTADAITIASIGLVAYVAWRSHGIIPAAGAVGLFWLAAPQTGIDRSFDVVVVGTLALAIAVSSRTHIGQTGWAMLCVGAAALAVYACTLGNAASETIRDDRRYWIVIAIALAGAGCAARVVGRHWRDRVGAAFLVLAPAIGMLIRFGQPQPAAWQTWTTEWRDSIECGTWSNAAWVWGPMLVSVALVAWGAWRALARGRKQLGQVPLAWITLFGTISMIATLGASSTAPDSLCLAAAGAILTAFGFGDTVLALVERIELRPPEKA